MGLITYFKDTDNLIDCLFVFSYFLSFIFYSQWRFDLEKNSLAEWTRASLAWLLLVGFMKGVNVMRSNTAFSFLARLIGMVLIEIIPFMVLFLSFTFIAAMIMHTLGVNLAVYEEEGVEPTDFTGLNWMGHFVWTFMNSNGEFDTGPIT
jgi:hypothetical protein